MKLRFKNARLLHLPGYQIHYYMYVCNLKIGAQNVLTFISLENLMYFENWSTKSNNINFSLKLFCLFFICLVSTGYQIHYI